MSLIWQHRAQLVTPIAPLVFTATKQTQSWTIKTTAGTQYRFDWGDGTSTTVVGNGADQTTTHDYDSAGTRTLLFFIRNGAALNTFICSDNGLAGTFPTVPLSWVNMVKFYCNYNALTGAAPYMGMCPTLTTVWFRDNQFTSYPAQTIASTVTLWRAENCLFTAAAINLMLANMALGIGARATGGSMLLGGTGNAAPTGQGLTDKATIAARPWTCTTN